MFRRTLLVLTLQYSLLLITIFTIFSASIYLYEDHSADVIATAAGSSVDLGLDQLRTVLAASYAVLLVVLPVVSYVLARRAIRPVVKSFEDQQRFVDDASHELRTPLSVLQAELELATSKRRSADEYHAAIDSSLEEVARLTSLIDNLLLLARGSHAQLHRSQQRIDLAQLLETQVDAIEKIYANKQLTFQVAAAEASIEGIPTLVGQSIANVLDNAAKFSKRQATITVSLDHEQGTAVITIADNGPGMSERQSRRAFDRFWRADSARNVKGFGLGLPLVQQIMILHGGSVQLRAAPGSGTIVTLMYPTAPSR